MIAMQKKLDDNNWEFFRKKIDILRLDMILIWQTRIWQSDSSPKNLTYEDFRHLNQSKLTKVHKQHKPGQKRGTKNKCKLFPCPTSLFYLLCQTNRNQDYQKFLKNEIFFYARTYVDCIPIMQKVKMKHRNKKNKRIKFSWHKKNYQQTLTLNFISIYNIIHLSYFILILIITRAK